jgi:hypothetical protein
MTRPQLAAMVPAFADELAGAGVSADAMLGGAADHLAALQQIGARVFDRFAATCR